MLTDRLLITLVHLRLGLPHAALGELYEVDRSPCPERSGRSAHCSRPATSRWPVP
ncbi:transposase family protein [Streptomyces sp. NPDC052101]|uniref:transposase family protein n=1 Tax=Streptomyces sp. NPDC052101 TaxID=3155763 RepID=UPI00341E3A18